MRSLLFFHGSQCAHDPRVELMLPLVQGNSYNYKAGDIQSQILGGSSWCQTLRLGRLPWGSGLSLLWQNFCSSVSSVVLKLFSSLRVAHPVGKGLAEQYIRKKKKKILQNQSLELGWFSGAKWFAMNKWRSPVISPRPQNSSIIWSISKKTVNEIAAGIAASPRAAGTMTKVSPKQRLFWFYLEINTRFNTLWGTNWNGSMEMD